MAKAPQNTVELPAVVDLDTLDGVRDGLVAAIERGPSTVSGAAVERISTNALLILLSGAESARRNNFAFKLKNVSAPMQAAIDRLGFGERFQPLMKG
ncbi:MAG TPA: STAS domain-containing protein [Devosiaceae bacterium]|jgi:anti-anti-sigma regulatory factor|nr:STAS domain-containing protein [Devosiaceae bacterium]